MYLYNNTIIVGQMWYVHRYIRNVLLEDRCGMYLYNKSINEGQMWYVPT